MVLVGCVSIRNERHFAFHGGGFLFEWVGLVTDLQPRRSFFFFFYNLQPNLTNNYIIYTDYLSAKSVLAYRGHLGAPMINPIPSFSGGLLPRSVNWLVLAVD